MSSISNNLSTQSLTPEASAAPPPVSDPLSGLANKNTFLKLLVAQIKNQNPLNPTDSVQFLSQLTQYSELEQLININTGVEKLTKSAAPAATNDAANKNTNVTTT